MGDTQARAGKLFWMKRGKATETKEMSKNECARKCGLLCNKASYDPLSKLPNIRTKLFFSIIAITVYLRFTCEVFPINF